MFEVRHHPQPSNRAVDLANSSRLPSRHVPNDPALSANDMWVGPWDGQRSK